MILMAVLHVFLPICSLFAPLSAKRHTIRKELSLGPNNSIITREYRHFSRSLPVKEDKAYNGTARRLFSR